MTMRNKLAKHIFSTVAVFCCSVALQQAAAQGCVAIRSTGGMCMADHGGSGHSYPKWVFNANHRYFKSFRHFRGDHEEKNRVAENTEVINHNHSLDLTLTHNLSASWSVGVSLPLISNTRSSLYEHDRLSRHTTKSFGLGDMRIAVYKWLFDPTKMPKGNIQAGLGIKLPTGDYRYQDYFYRNDSTSVLAPVDQSIQLGDGGTGLTIELNAFRNFSSRVGVYGNFYYLVNPREQNGVSTARGATPSTAALRNGSSVMSVPDQYMVRAGASYHVGKFTITGGGRMECVPSEDLIGGSSGFRRPGYVISAEPSIAYSTSRFSVYTAVPVALERNRTQSYADKIQSRLTKTHTIGDAAFADYAINVGFAVRF